MSLAYQIELDANTAPLKDVRDQIQHLGSAMKAVLAAGGLGVTLAKFKDGLSAGLAYNSKLQEIRRGLSAVSGSAALTTLRMEELKRTEENSRFDVAELANVSRQLEIMTDGALASGDGLKLVADVAAATNTPLASVADALGRVYGQIQAGDPELGRGLQQLVMMGAISARTKEQVEALARAHQAPGATWSALAGSKDLSRFSGGAGAAAGTYQGQLFQVRQALEEAFGAGTEKVFGSLQASMRDLTTSLRSNGARDAIEQIGAATAAAAEKITTLTANVLNNRDAWAGVTTTLGGAASIFAGVKVSQYVGKIAELVKHFGSLRALLTGGGGLASGLSKLSGWGTAAYLAAEFVGKPLIKNNSMRDASSSGVQENQFSNAADQATAGLSSIHQRDELVQKLSAHAEELQQRLAKLREAGDWRDKEQAIVLLSFLEQLERKIAKIKTISPDMLNARSAQQAAEAYRSAMAALEPLLREHSKLALREFAGSEFEEKVKFAPGDDARQSLTLERIKAIRAEMKGLSAQPEYAGPQNFDKRSARLDELKKEAQRLGGTSSLNLLREEAPSGGQSRELQNILKEKSTRFEEYQLELKILNLRNAGNEAGAESAEKELAIRKRTAELLQIARDAQDRDLAPARAKAFVEAELLSRRPQPSGAALMPQANNFERAGLFVGGITNTLQTKATTAVEKSREILQQMYTFMQQTKTTPATHWGSS